MVTTMGHEGAPVDYLEGNVRDAPGGDSPRACRSSTERVRSVVRPYRRPGRLRVCKPAQSRGTRAALERTHVGDRRAMGAARSGRADAAEGCGLPIVRCRLTQLGDQ